MKDAPLTESQTNSSSEMDEHSAMEQALHATEEVLNVVEKGRHVMGKHVPGILGPVINAVEMGVDIMAQHTEDPVANVVCGTVTAAAKITTGIATMAVTIGACRAVPQLVAPLVTTAIGEVVVTGGLGFAAHHIFDPIVKPVGDTVNRVCHRTVALVREVTNTPCASHHPTVLEVDVNLQQNPLLGASEKLFTAIGEQRLSADREESALPHPQGNASKSPWTVKDIAGGVGELVIDAAETLKKMEDSPAKNTQLRAVDVLKNAQQTDEKKTPATTPSKTEYTPKLNPAHSLFGKSNRRQTVAGQKQTPFMNALQASRASKSTLGPQQPQEKKTMPLTIKRSTPKNPPKTSYRSGGPTAAEQTALDEQLTEIVSDETLSPQQKADKINQVVYEPLKHAADAMSKKPVTGVALQDVETLKSISSGADAVARCAYAAGVMARLMGSDKAEAFGKIMNGACMAGAGATSLSSGFNVGGAAMFVGGMLEFGEGLGGLFGLSNKDDNAPNPMLIMLEQLSQQLALISNQIAQLGQYIEKRFDRLEKIMERQHLETMQLLRTIWYNQSLTGSDIQALFKRHQNKLLIGIRSVKDALEVIRTTQLQNIEMRIADRLALTAEFHFLQGLLNRDLVNEVLTTMKRPDELLTQFEHYSRRLMLALTITSCRGSASVTGSDLSFDFTSLSAPQLELLRTRWLSQTTTSPTYKSLQTLSAYNIDALLGFAQIHGAVPVNTPELPNLVLLKDRAGTFLKLHKAYVEKKRTLPNERVAISESVYHHLTDVAAVLQQTMSIIRDIQFKKVIDPSMAELLKQQKIMKDAATVEESTFSKAKTQLLLTNRAARLNDMVPLIQSMRYPDKITIPTENSVFTYQLNFVVTSARVGGFSGRYYEETNALMRAYLGGITLTADRDCYEWLGFDEVSQYIPAQSSSWTSATAAFFEKKILSWNPTQKDDIAPIDLRLQLGLIPEKEQTKGAAIHATRIRAQTQALTDTVALVSQSRDKQETIALFKKDYLNFTGNNHLKKLYTLGPRVVKPAPGNGSRSLYLNTADFDRCIPSSAFFAEDAGEGEIVLQYSAEMELTAENTHAVSFALLIQYIPKNRPLTPVIFLNAAVRNEFSNAYKDLNEIILAWWYGDQLFSQERIDLSCDLFKHDNPFFKREAYQTIPKTMASRLAAISPAALEQNKTAMNTIADALLVKWRCELNQNMMRMVEAYQGALGGALIQSESMLMMLRCFASSVAQAHYEASWAVKLDSLSLITPLDNLLKGFNGKIPTNPLGATGLDYITELFIKHKTQIETVKTQLLATRPDLGVRGDRELELLHEQLLTCQQAVEIAVVPVPEVPHEDPGATQANELIDSMRQRMTQLEAIIAQLTEQQPQVDDEDDAAAQETADEDEAELHQVTVKFLTEHDVEMDEEDDDLKALWVKPNATPGKRVLARKYNQNDEVRGPLCRYLQKVKFFDAQQRKIEGNATIVVQLPTKKPGFDS